MIAISIRNNSSQSTKTYKRLTKKKAVKNDIRQNIVRHNKRDYNVHVQFHCT